jgi:hypothetical protein
MAQTIQVAGPTKIQYKIGTGGTYADLGYTDNDSLPTITYSDTVHEVKTVEYGDQPAEVVVTGMTAVVSFTLVKWDAAHWDDIVEQLRGASYEATVGRLLINANEANTAHTIGIKILPSRTGSQSYELPFCYLQGDTSDSQFGNVERRLTATFKAVQRLGSPAVVVATV